MFDDMPLFQFKPKVLTIREVGQMMGAAALTLLIGVAFLVVATYRQIIGR